MKDPKLVFTWISILVKVIATGFCFFYFLINVVDYHKRYELGYTINTINLERQPDPPWIGPPMPWIVFCLKTPFKNSSKILLTPDEFVSNTFDPQENVAKITYFPTNPTNGNTGKQIQPSRKSIFTTHNGNCLVLMFNRTFIRSEEYINIELKEPEKVFAYVLRPGEDIYLIYNMFPNESPEKLLFPEASGYYDIFLAYEDLVDKAAKEDECVPDEKEWINTQASCIRQNAQMLVRKDDCTLPWTWSILGYENSSKHFVKCEENQFIKHRDFLVWKYLVNFPSEDCKRQCHRRIVTTKVKQVTSNAHPCLSGDGNPETCAFKHKKMSNSTTDVGFWFSSVKHVKTTYTKPLIDWGTLIANIGGAMGLFLGWGLLDFIIQAYEYLIRLICFMSKRFFNTPLDIFV